MKTNFMKSTGMLIANMTLASGLAVAQIGGGASGAMTGQAMTPGMGSAEAGQSAPMAGQGNNANPEMGGTSGAPSNDSAASNSQLNSDLAAERPDKVKLDSDEAAGDDAPVRSETEVSNLDSVDKLDDYARSQAPESRPESTPENGNGGDAGQGTAELESAADTAMTGAEQRINAAQGGASSNTPQPEQNSGGDASASQSEQLMTAAGDASATLQGQAEANSPDNAGGGSNGSADAPEAPSANSVPVPSSDRVMNVAEAQANYNAPENNGDSNAGADLQSELSAAANSAPSQNDLPESNGNGDAVDAEAQAQRVTSQLQSNAPQQDAPEAGGNGNAEAGGEERISASTRDLPNDNRAPETPEATQTVTVRTAADRDEEDRPSELSADSRDATQPLRDNSPRELPEIPRAQTRLSERAEAADENPVAEEE